MDVENKAERRKWKNIDDYKYEEAAENRKMAKYHKLTLYGFLGMKQSRLASKPQAETVTTLGRALILFTAKCLEDQGYEIVYGDTDSVFVQLKEKDSKAMVEEGKRITDYVNSKYDEFAKSYNMDRHFFLIKPEVIFKRLLMQEKTDKKGKGSKKVYSGWIIWDDDVFYSEHVLSSRNMMVKGATGIKSSFPSFGSKVQNSIRMSILRGFTVEKLKEQVNSAVVLHTEMPLEDIMIPSTLNKKLADYKKPTLATQAVKWSNTNLGTRFGLGSRFMVVYVNMPSTHVVAVPYNKKVPASIRRKINWNKMEDRNIWKMVNPLLNAVGVTQEQIESERYDIGVLDI